MLYKPHVFLNFVPITYNRYLSFMYIFFDVGLIERSGVALLLDNSYIILSLWLIMDYYLQENRRFIMAERNTILIHRGNVFHMKLWSAIDLFFHPG